MPLTTENWLLFLSDYGIALVFFGALFEGETIIILAGVLSHQSVLPFMWTVCAAAVGAFVGDQVSFYIGRRYGSKVLTRFPRATQLADRVRLRLTTSADWIAFGCRFVYGERKSVGEGKSGDLGGRRSIKKKKKKKYFET